MGADACVCVHAGQWERTDLVASELEQFREWPVACHLRPNGGSEAMELFAHRAAHDELRILAHVERLSEEVGLDPSGIRMSLSKRPEHMRAQETMVDWGGDLSTL